MATVKKTGTELNWTVEKKVARGKVNGYSVALLQNTDLMARQPVYKTMVVSFDEINQEQAEALVKFVDENKKVLRIINYKVSATFINIYVNEGVRGLNATNLTEALNTLVEGFTRTGIQPQSKCVVCNQETTEEVISNRIAVRAHRACFTQATEEIKEAKANVKYGKGIFGAVAGAMVGSLIFFVAYLFFMAYPLFLLPVGFAAFFGYKLLGGEFTDKAKWIIFASSAIVVLAMVAFFVAIDAAFLEASFADVLFNNEFGQAEFYGYSVLWGLLSGMSGYQLAKRREF